MSDVIGNLVVKVDMDSADFDRGLKSLQKEASQYGRQVRNLTKASQDQNYSLGMGSKALEAMRKQYSTLNSVAGQYVNKLKETKEGTDQYDYLSRKLETTASQMAKLKSEYSVFAQNMVRENDLFYKMSNGLNKAGDRMMNFGRSISKVGDVITRVGAVATAGGAVFVKSAMDYEKGLVQIKKTTGETDAGMAKISKSIMGMAKEMPIAIDQLQNVGAIAGQLGIKGADNITRFTEVMTKIGTATSLSAEEASEAIARFTNVSGTGTKTIDRIGSSLVALGNNFATTETEIMSMASQLVGTLSTMNVAEADILGLSAGMSAMGITAERGASSVSKFFVDMSSAVSEGGEQLGKLAKVAGMTSDEFANLFHKDSMGAFQSFINGLGKAKKEGKDLVPILEDLGIKEIRMRDTILKLANGYKTMNSALETSRKAYQENLALEQEYQTQLESTSAQWEIAKNKLKLFAIEIGNALLPSIMDLLNSTGGLQDMARDFSDWFTGIDQGLRTNIVKWGALAIALGPVVSGIGNVISIGGGILKLFSGITGAVSTVTQAFKLLKLGGITGEAMALTGAVGKVASVLGFLSSPLGIATAGLTALGAGFAYVASEAIKSQRIQANFPSITDVTDKQAASLYRVRDAYTKVGAEISNLNQNSNMDSVVGGLGEIQGEIEKLNSEKIDKLRESFAKLPESVQGNLKGSLDATIKNIEQQTQRVQDAMDRLGDIQEKTVKNSGVIPEKYLKEVQGLTQEILGDYAISLGKTAKQTDQIYQQMTKSYKDMTGQEVLMREEQIKKFRSAEDKLYQEQLDAFHQYAQEANLGYAEYKENQATLERSHNSRMMALNSELIRSHMEAQKRVAESLGKSFDENSETYQRALAYLERETGLSKAEIKAIWETDPIDFGKMTQGAQEAFNKLNEAINDSGIDMANINTEGLEKFIEEAKEAGLTWDELELLSKDANIDDNTREFVNKVLESGRVWDFMTLEEKMAMIGVEGADQVNEALAEIGGWNAIDAKVQELVANGTPAQEAINQAMSDLQVFNAMSPEEKILVADGTIASQEIRTAIQQQDLWNNTEFVDKYLNAIANTDDAEGAVQSLLAQWGIFPSGDTKVLTAEANTGNALTNLGALVGYWLINVLGLQPAQLTAEDNTGEATGSAEANINKVQGMEAIAKLLARNETGGPVGEATSAVDDFGALTPKVPLNAENNASVPVGAASALVTTYGLLKPNVPLKATDNASAAVARAQGYINSLRGKTVTNYINTIYRTFGRHHKTGTKYHEGGLAILGDGMKKEPFLTPDGYFGVSPARNTEYNLPEGTKVWPSIANFKREALKNINLQPFVDRLPKYKTGTDKSFLDELRKIKVPEKYLEQTKSETTVTPESAITMNVTVQVVGDSINRYQADKLIEPLVEAGKRYSKRTGQPVRIGG
ncbi:phage tail tape measure protein [Eremococcus coleocola]|uniref:phage tail tape measure protein n=1 Tax=Eremococcus coleocola TaxID=88132 RepID=UPI00040DD9EA|nr:phage tail tape measure protein [Eremococcus coleocola]